MEVRTVDWADDPYAEIYRRIALALMARRRQMGYRHADVARWAGLDRTSVSKILHGHRRPSIETLLRICVALRRQPTHFIPPLEAMEDIFQAYQNEEDHRIAVGNPT